MVIVRRSLVYEARVDVHAGDQAEAEREAQEQADQDLVNWVQVHAEQQADVHDG